MRNHFNRIELNLLTTTEFLWQKDITPKWYFRICPNIVCNNKLDTNCFAFLTVMKPLAVSEFYFFLATNLRNDTPVTVSCIAHKLSARHYWPSNFSCFVCLVFSTSSSTTRLFRGRVPRLTSDNFYMLPHMRQSWETMTFVSAGHIILTPTQPVGSGRPQRESNTRPPHKESRALPTELPRILNESAWNTMKTCKGYIIHRNYPEHFDEKKIRIRLFAPLMPMMVTKPFYRLSFISYMPPISRGRYFLYIYIYI